MMMMMMYSHVAFDLIMCWFLVCLPYVTHFKLRIITLVATKVQVILWSFVVLTWMHDTIELV
jgi:hypothetical protein